MRPRRHGDRPRAPFPAAALVAAGLALPGAALAQAGADKYTDESYRPAVSAGEMASRIGATRRALQERTGRVARSARRVHPVRTVDWFLDEAGTEKAGRALPGAPFIPVGQSGAMTQVRMTGWQLAEVPRVLYAEAGDRVLLATLGEAAQGARVQGAPVTLEATGQAWVPVEVAGWIATADLTGETGLLWDHAQALYTAACAQCHAAPHLDEFDANQWSGQFDAMVDQTTLQPDEARLVKTYLQLHAAAPEATPGPTGLAMGQLLYRQLCESCHGETATAGASGDIRDTGASMLRSVAGGFESMPAIVMTEAEIEAIVGYLAHLRGAP